ncbi:MAG: hypothetical protein CL847_06970 [Crocinitomicaceae bacterium]|nr:hypothetical protein [Crocinitomicaceae bacterium]
MESRDSLRVLHIASWYPSKVHKSLGNFIQRHISAIATKHVCELWYSSPIHANDPLMGSISIDDSNGFVERIVYPKATRPGVRAVTRSLLNFELGENIAMPDIIHLHVTFPAGRAARILSEKWDIPLVITEHWTAYHDSQHIPLWRRIAMRRTASATSVFCPVTHQLGQTMRQFKMVNRNGTETYRVIPNVVDTEKFKLCDIPKSKSDGLKILHVSSLEEAQKNITGILNTISYIRTTHPDFKFTLKIVGGSEIERLNEVRSYATIMKLVEPYVKFTGALSGETVAEEMRNSDAVLLFSRKENFPCVIAEAWSCGKPVITTDVGGIAEHMAPERGKMVKSGDEQALAKAILALDKPWDAEKIRSYAVENFSIEAVAEAYSEVYSKALSISSS